MTSNSQRDSDALVAPRSWHFEPTMQWNAPVPIDAPANPNEAAILEYLATAEESGDGCLTLAGATDSTWGQPIYWAGRGDREYDVEAIPGGQATSTGAIRIPDGAAAADNSRTAP